MFPYHSVWGPLPVGAASRLMPKVLNGCISALWDDARRELDESVIPGVGPPPVF